MLKPKSEIIRKKLSHKDFDLLYKMIKNSQLSKSAHFLYLDEMNEDYQKWGYGNSASK
jgi:hypothetical protein